MIKLIYSKARQHTWVKDPYVWFYTIDGIHTGIFIDKITELKITPYQSIKLEKPKYRISFLSPHDRRLYHLVDYHSLGQAQRIAEWYYKEWEAVNSNGTVSYRKSTCRGKVPTKFSKDV